MHTVSAAYKRMAADPDCVWEMKAVIAGVEYDQDQIDDCSTYCDMIPDLTVGSCVSRELDLTVSPLERVPRAAKITIFYRLILGDEKSEWVPNGVFYVDTRSDDDYTDQLTLHCVDAIMRTEATWWDGSVDTGEWPISQKAAAEDIAARIGTTLDPRSVIGPYLMDYPNDMTMREALEEIAAANGGNWTMTGDGALLLVPLGGLPSETDLLVDNEDGGAILFGDVRIIV